MSDSSDQQLFVQATIRRAWHNDTWYYSVVDVIAVLSESPNPRNYWNMLKARLKDEGASATLDEVVQLRLKAADGRFRQTDTASRETLLRIIQSVPSPRAEPFKAWLAQVGEERIQEIEHPEAALERVRQSYLAKGYTPEWIESRIRSDLVRNDLTDEWKARGAREGIEFAILTNEIHQNTRRGSHGALAPVEEAPPLSLAQTFLLWYTLAYETHRTIEVAAKPRTG